MHCTIEKFRELYGYGREDDGWDYKRDLSLDTAKEKYRLLKDVLAFSNYGGGYLVIGVDKNNSTLVNIPQKIDPARLSETIERTLGKSIAVELNYFHYTTGHDIFQVALLYIPGASEILETFQDFSGDDNKVIIYQNDVYTRRGTRTVKASAADITDMLKRHQAQKGPAVTDSVSADKYPVYTDNLPLSRYLGQMLDNQYEFNARTCGISLRYLLQVSPHSKKDFGALVGVSEGQWERFLLGDEIPPLELLIRVSGLCGVPLRYFFSFHHYGRPPFWTEDDLQFVLLRLLKPAVALDKIQDVDLFLGRVVYETARAVKELGDLLDADRPILRLAEGQTKAFKEELQLQYYKLLEQIPVGSRTRGMTREEEMILGWFHCNNQYLARIFVEAIQSIGLLQSGRPHVVFYFTEELRKLEIKGRNYDTDKKKVRFSGIKLSYK
jgi:transcriptional regulator with XRE-family HTH domain